MFAAFHTAICENYAMRRPTEFDNHSYLQEIAEILGSHKRATFWSHLYEKNHLTDYSSHELQVFNKHHIATNVTSSLCSKHHGRHGQTRLTMEVT